MENSRTLKAGDSMAHCGDTTSDSMRAAVIIKTLNVIFKNINRCLSRG